MKDINNNQLPLHSVSWVEPNLQRLYDTIFICSKNKNIWKLTVVRNKFQIWTLNTSNLICLTLCSINFLTITEWRHYYSNSLNAVTQTISQSSLKKNELIYFINYFFSKNLNVNLFMCLHLETNSPHVLSSNSGSPFMIASFSVKQRSHFLVPTVYGRAL